MTLWLVSLVLGSAQIIGVSGDVQLLTPGKAAYSAAKEGEELPLGSRVKTGVGGEVSIKLNDGSLLKLKERSAMQVREVTTEQREKTAVVLFFGRLWSKISKQRDPSFDVVSPTTVAGVRGTEFTTAVGEDGHTRVDVDEGTVAVSNEGKQASVGAGKAAEADASSLDQSQGSSGPKDEKQWQKWQEERRRKLQKNGETIAKDTQRSLTSRNEEVKRLLAEQKKLKESYANAENDDERARIKQQLRKNAARLSELSVKTEGQFGAFEHWGELAEDPEFGAKFYGAGFIKQELGKMRQLKASLDKMIAEGTDMSMKGMEKMLDDMGKNKKKNSLEDKPGSAADDLFK